MSTFGYTESTGEAAKNALDQNLQWVSYYLDRIRHSVPQAGALPGLDEAKELVEGEVSGLHEEIDKRTEVPA
jgi:hypothetical protein